MFVRIVKLTFEPSAVEEFTEVFEKNKAQIRSTPGCSFLELYREKDQRNVFFTYSYWDSEKHLEAYRKSDFFREIWSGIKTRFSERPEAWSVEKLQRLE